MEMLLHSVFSNGFESDLQIKLIVIILLLFSILLLLLVIHLNVRRTQPLSLPLPLTLPLPRSSNTVSRSEEISLPVPGFPFPMYIINLDRKPERYTYVSKQLDALGVIDYHRWPATDGFKTDPQRMLSMGITPKLVERRGLAGCASSHIRLWQHLAAAKCGWTLILEDDVHFHPQFVQLFESYWKEVPSDAKIVFLGFCGDDEIEKDTHSLVNKSAMCTHAYMISEAGARYLLDNLIPIDDPVDITIVQHFTKLNHQDCYSFNGNIKLNGIRPNDYKELNGRRCMFNGIIYQNMQEQGSTIHGEETLYQKE